MMNNPYNVAGMEDLRIQDFVSKTAGVSQYQVVKVLRAMRVCATALKEDNQLWNRLDELLVHSATSAHEYDDSLTSEASDDSWDACDEAFDRIMEAPELKKEFMKLRDTRNRSADTYYQIRVHCHDN